MSDGIEIGMAGQLRVAAELILHGHKPAISLIDKGVDLITEDGLRIQVKTGRLQNRQAGLRYHFNMQRWDKRGPHGLSNVDFVICWGINTNEFWVIPADIVRQLNNFNVTPNSKRPDLHGAFPKTEFLNAWHLLKKGKGDAE